MRINEEIYALEVMGIRAVTYLASTRIIAGILVVIPLYAVAVLMSFIAAKLLTIYVYGQSKGVYEHYFSTFLRPNDLLWSFFSALAMATGVMVVHTYYGFTATGGPAVMVAALAGLSGWLGYRAYQQHDAQARRNLFVATARQGAVNLTTINYTQVDRGVQRILDSATGVFRDEFEQWSKPFAEVVKAAQSKSEGTVPDTGLESQRGDSAQVLVAVAVKSHTAGGDEPPREWRIRIEVRSVGDDAKVSNMVFVP